MVLALGAQDDAGAGLVYPGGTRAQQPADPSCEPPPRCLPWRGWQLRPPQLVSPPASCPGDAAEEEEERQVRLLLGGWGRGWGQLPPQGLREGARGPPGLSRGPQTQQGGGSPPQMGKLRHGGGQHPSAVQGLTGMPIPPPPAGGGPMPRGPMPALPVPCPPGGSGPAPGMQRGGSAL